MTFECAGLAGPVYVTLHALDRWRLRGRGTAGHTCRDICEAAATGILLPRVLLPWIGSRSRKVGGALWVDRWAVILLLQQDNGWQAVTAVQVRPGIRVLFHRHGL